MKIPKIFKRKKVNVTMEHYAPDVTISAIDYIQPLESQKRLKQAEYRIREFLDHTNPDSLCGGFFDRMVEREDQLLYALLRYQLPEHRDTNRSIAEKHKATMVRLEGEIEKTKAQIAGCTTEIMRLQRVYDRVNGKQQEEQGEER